MPYERFVSRKQRVKAAHAANTFPNRVASMALMTRFARQAAVMMTGTALAQAIPLLAAPLLTRLYTPEQFGAFSAVVAASSIASIIASVRYELAILLPERDAEAFNVAFLALGLALVSSISLVLLGLVPGLVSALWHYSVLLWDVVAFMTCILAFTQIFNIVATRQRKFQLIASSLVLQQATAVVVALVAAYAVPLINGLIAGRVVGLIGGTLVLFVSVLPWLREGAPQVRPKLMRKLAVVYRQFPQFNVPYSFLAAFSRELLILCLVAMGQTAAAGQYGLARTVLLAPIGFLSSSLSQVFYREAAESLGTPAFRRLTMILFVSIASGLAPVFVLAWLWAPTAFEIIFGAPWRTAGEFASLLIPIVFLSLFTSWPERVFEVSGKQKYSLVIQLTFDGSSIVAVLLALQSGLSIKSTIALYVSIQAVYHVTYLCAVFRLSKLSFGIFFAFVAYVIGLLILSAFVFVPITQIAAASLFWLVILGLLAVSIGGLTVLVANRLLNQLSIGGERTAQG